MRHISMLALAVGLLAGAGAAQAATTTTFTTLDNPGDPTFNQLLGINNNGVISGYFGSGAVGHPNQGYTIAPPYTTFLPANAPGSVQTQATGINAAGNITGFWSDTNTGSDANFGFIRWSVNKNDVIFIDVNDPLVGGAPLVTQVLGMNAAGLAAGFYNDANGVSHGFVYNVMTSDYTPVNVANSVSDAATGINKSNLICGFWTDAKGIQHGFTKALTGGAAETFTVPGAAVTQLLGVNSNGITVGFYQMNANDITHGLTYNPANGVWNTLDNPNGIQGTVLNGLNDKGQIVGFYTDAAGNVHGQIINNAP